LLDPELCLSMPRFVTACTGVDAIGHALETAVTTRRNAASTSFARAAFRLASDNFEGVLERPDDLAARGAMLKAATYAGLAIEHSMLGAAHSMANPLTARCGLPHGQAVGMVLPAVVAFNAEDPGARAEYVELARVADLGGAGDSDEQLIAALSAKVTACLRAAGFPPSLTAAGVDPGSGPQLAREAAQQWTAQFNPRPVGEPEFQELYEVAW